MNAIGPFTLKQILGQGGMATVYLSEHPELGRLALRVIRKEATKEQQEIVDAERTGAVLHQLLSSAGCPAVPRAYPPYEDDLYFCVPVEFVEGQTLAHYLSKQQRCREDEAIFVALALCRNLQFAHQFKGMAQGVPITHVVHGDLKPANIMLTPAKEVRILDYGISKPMRENQDRTRNIFGAACYSSPERLLEKRLDHYSDLWSLGVILYEMISGRRPYEGGESEVKAAMAAGRTPAPLREGSVGYQAIVRKALARNPAERYPSAADLRSDLEKLGRGEDPLALTPPDATKTAAADRTVRDPGGATLRTPPPPPPKPSPFSTLVSRIAAIVALCLILWFGWLVNREFSLAKEADQFTRDLASRNDVTAADWVTYDSLTKRSNMSWSLSGARGILNERLKESAFRAIKDYREGYNQALAGTRRQSAELSLRRALTLDPEDRQTRAMLHIVEAYGSAWTNEEAARNSINTFEKAASLWTASPDAHLGIARVAAYQMQDPDRLERALEQAERRGYHRLDRDIAMAADCRRLRGENLLRTMRKRSCEDVDSSLIERVRLLLRTSIDEYRQIPQLTSTPKSLDHCRRLLEEADKLCTAPAPSPLPQ